MVNQKVYGKLKELAKNNKMLTYSELNTECSLNLDFNNIKDRGEIAHILGEISIYEHEHNHPLLSAVIILKNSKPLAPAYGFYNLVHELKLKEDGEKDEIFWAKELGKCFDYWKKN